MPTPDLNGIGGGAAEHHNVEGVAQPLPVYPPPGPDLPAVLVDLQEVGVLVEPVGEAAPGRDGTHEGAHRRLLWKGKKENFQYTDDKVLLF